jgi:hypothetical protein
MVTEKEKLIRAYIEGVQDGAGAVLKMVNKKKLTMEQMPARGSARPWARTDSRIRATIVCHASAAYTPGNIGLRH